MKKKVLSLCVVGALAATTVVGGTLAYFTDTDSDKNVMTVGNVKIVQNEEQRVINSDGTIDDSKMEEFKNDKKLYPAVIVGTEDNSGASYDGTVEFNDKTYKIFDESVNNEVDKFITVTNRGTEDAYVRTILAFEDDKNGSLTPMLHTLWGDPDGDGKYTEKIWVANESGEFVHGVEADVLWLQNNDGSWLTIEDEQGVTYTVCIVTYKDALESKATSDPSLMQIWLDPSATNEWSETVGDTYDIMALSQAIQAAGFDNAYDALEANFKLTQSNIEKWFKEVEAKTTKANNVIGGALDAEETTAAN